LKSIINAGLIILYFSAGREGGIEISDTL